MILVDPLRTVQRSRRWPFEEAAHLVSDESWEELHRFARAIGLRADWFQGDHYDLSRERFELAIANGAVRVSARELVTRRLRQARPLR